MRDLWVIDTDTRVTQGRAAPDATGYASIRQTEAHAALALAFLAELSVARADLD